MIITCPICHQPTHRSDGTNKVPCGCEKSTTPPRPDKPEPKEAGKFCISCKKDGHTYLECTEFPFMAATAGLFGIANILGSAQSEPAYFPRSESDRIASEILFQSEPESAETPRIDLALEQMRFGCPLKPKTFGEKDAEAYELRMQVAADVIEQELSATKARLSEAEKRAESKHGCWMTEIKRTTAAESERDGANEGYEKIKAAHAAYIINLRDLLGMKTPGDGFQEFLVRLKQDRDAVLSEVATLRATIAELTTDANAVTLAANLAMKSEEAERLRGELAEANEAMEQHAAFHRKLSLKAVEERDTLTAENARLKADGEAMKRALEETSLALATSEHHGMSWTVTRKLISDALAIHAAIAQGGKSEEAPR